MSSRVFLVSCTIEIPVVADSEEEAREFLLDEDCDVIEQAAAQVKASIDDNDDDLVIEEITEDLLDEKYEGYADLVPWGDDRGETIGERVRAESEYSDDDEDRLGFEAFAQIQDGES